jgi:hypothetical protein
MQYLVLILGLMLSFNSFAMRCGTHLVEVGDYAPIVMNRCGEPLSINRYESSGYAYNAEGFRVPTGVQVIEEWIYQRSPNAFMYILTFQDGKLQKIETTRNQ